MILADYRNSGHCLDSQLQEILNSSRFPKGTLMVPLNSQSPSLNPVFTHLPPGQSCGARRARQALRHAARLREGERRELAGARQPPSLSGPWAASQLPHGSTSQDHKRTSFSFSQVEKHPRSRGVGSLAGPTRARSSLGKPTAKRWEKPASPSNKTLQGPPLPHRCRIRPCSPWPPQATWVQCGRA